MKLRLLLALATVMIATWSPVYAAFRVYRLRIAHYDYKGVLERTRQVMSTLDPVQYEHYNSGYGRMRVEMIDTWLCPGDTGMKAKYCKRPKNARKDGADFLPEKRTPFPLPPTRSTVTPVKAQATR